MTEPAELGPVYKEAYTLIKGTHFRLTFELFISKLYWNYIDVKYCVKEELQLCYNHNRFVSFGYIKFTWQQYNCKLRCAIESTTVLFSRSVNTNNIYATTGQSRNRIGNYVVSFERCRSTYPTHVFMQKSLGQQKNDKHVEECIRSQ